MAERDLNELNAAMLIAYTAADPDAREMMLLNMAQGMAELANSGGRITLKSVNGDIGELAANIATLALALSQEISR